LDPFASHIFDCYQDLSQHSKPVTYKGNNELQLERMEDLLDPNKDREFHHNNLAPFFIHENPQFLIQKDTVMIEDETDFTVNEIEQYYYMTNDNQFMLVYPNYNNLDKKYKVILEIAKKHTYNIFQEDEEYNYDDDLKQRKLDYKDGKYKKISHICYDSYRNKNHMKKSSHLYDIIYSRADKIGSSRGKMKTNERLILSTD